MRDTIAALNVGGYQYTEVFFTRFQYMDGTLAILCHEVADPETPITTVTVNLAAYAATPEGGCVFVKSYSENLGLEESLFEQGLIQPTGRSVVLPHGTVVKEYRLLAPFRALLGLPE